MKSSKPSYNILIVEDNSSIHEDFDKILKNKSEMELPSLEEDEALLFNIHAPEPKEKYTQYNLYHCTQGNDVIPLIEAKLKENMKFSAAFVDIRMPPGWDGIRTIEEMWKIDPDIQVVICTAHSDYSWEDIIAKFGYSDKLFILKKPFENIEVNQLAASLSRKWEFNQEIKEKIKNLSSINLMESTLNLVSTGILSVDKNRMITYFNTNFMNMFGIPKQLLDKRESTAVIEFISEQLLGPIGFTRMVDEMWEENLGFVRDELICKDGRIIEYQSQPHMINSNSFGRVTSFSDVTEIRDIEEKLLQDSMHDSLTGINNRRFFNQEIEEVFKKKTPRDSGIAILILDLDRFKYVNDNFGHEIGDELLKEVSKRLSSIIPNDAVLSRFGGDEFIILFKDIKNRKKLDNLVKKIFDIFNTPFVVNKVNFPISISIGGRFVEPSEDVSAVDIIRQADISMYQGKKTGVNNFQLYDAKMHHDASERISINNALQKAIDKKEFYLYYQPFIDAKTNKILGVEALIRWKHPIFGLVPPMKFIDLSEEMGSITDITEWVLKTACTQMKNWVDKGLSQITLNINLSGKQLTEEKTVDMIMQVLEEKNFDPKYLLFEITESLFFEKNKFIHRTLDRLKQTGVRFAIDNFGTGYSNLMYLKDSPVDTLKIDQSFVSCINTNITDASIVSSIISMAHNLGLIVIAEGVETKEQMDFLKLHHCDGLQGFYLCHPLDEKDCFAILKTGVIDSKGLGNALF